MNSHEDSWKTQLRVWFHSQRFRLSPPPQTTFCLYHSWEDFDSHRHKPPIPFWYMALLLGHAWDLANWFLIQMHALKTSTKHLECYTMLALNCKEVIPHPWARIKKKQIHGNGQPTSITKWKPFCNLELQLWLANITSRDVQSASFKASRHLVMWWFLAFFLAFFASGASRGSLDRGASLEAKKRLLFCCTTKGLENRKNQARLRPSVPPP